MNLFIDAVSSSGIMLLFDENRKILASQAIELKMKESKLLLSLLDAFLKSNSISYEDLENIVCVHGPGSFTGIRTITLVVNTISYVHKHIQLTGISFFDLYNKYPIVKASSKRDVFIKKSQEADIEIIQNEDMKRYCDDVGITKIYGDVDISNIGNLSLAQKINYDILIQDIIFKTESRLQALYIKKPNIS